MCPCRTARNTLTQTSAVTFFCLLVVKVVLASWKQRAEVTRAKEHHKQPLRSTLTGTGTGPGDGARGEVFKLGLFVETQISPPQHNVQASWLFCRQHHEEAAVWLLGAKSAVWGGYPLGSALGEEQLQSTSSHAVYLLRKSFSGSLMNEIAVINKCPIVWVLLHAKKWEFLCTTSKEHLTLCGQFLLLIITHWKARFSGILR